MRARRAVVARCLACLCAALVSLCAACVLPPEQTRPSGDIFVATDGGGDAQPSIATLEQLFTENVALSASERSGAPAGYRVYDVTLTQPLDPDDTSAGTFEQRAALYVKTDAAASDPLVLIPSGYDLANADRLDAITELLVAHQLVIEYRYNGASRPAGDAAFAHLRARAAAADVHAFVLAFKRYFVGRWISVGRSRGGSVALHHRAIYDGDVAGTVAVATPDIDGAPDGRWVAALSSLGDAACRSRLQALQRAMLSTRRAELFALFTASQPTGTTFVRIGGDKAAYEATVLDLSLSYWQSYGKYPCDGLPAVSASAATLYDLLISSVGDLATDAQQDYYSAYFIIAHREDGYPQLPNAHLADVLETTAPDLTRGTVPAGVDASYDGAFDKLVDDWIETKSHDIVFLRGELDAWGAVRHPVAPARRVVEYLVTGVGHSGVRVANLAPSDRDAVEKLLRGWVAADAQLP
ncbi:MAG: hypothetical protein KC503_02300 [Myxococcales bacterium]|nr:hypothetical protein [Myxococcales bacterium]